MTTLDPDHPNELADFAVLVALSSLGTPEVLGSQWLAQQLRDQHGKPDAEAPVIDGDRLFAVAQHLHRAGLLGSAELTYRAAVMRGSTAAAAALADLLNRDGRHEHAHRPGLVVASSEGDQRMTLDTITPFTRCPSVFGGQVWHYPSFENCKPLTLAAMGITLIGYEPTIMLAACGSDHLVPPSDESDEHTDAVMCGGCVYVRYGDTHGFPAPSMPTATGSTDHDRPSLRLVSG